jgi:hypothetical protein
MQSLAEEISRAERYREKAEECRALAARMSDRLAREAFLDVGRSYERLAEQLDEKIQFMRKSRHRS